MELAMNLAQALARDMCVKLGRADARMAKKLLDYAQIGAVFQKMRGERMTQHMRRDIAGDAAMAPLPAAATQLGQRFPQRLVEQRSQRRPRLRCRDCSNSPVEPSVLDVDQTGSRCQTARSSAQRQRPLPLWTCKPKKILDFSFAWRHGIALALCSSPRGRQWKDSRKERRR